MKLIKSVYNFNYQVNLKEFLEIRFYSLNSLDESIDALCEVLGKSKMDDALKEDYCPYFGIPWEAGLGLAQYLSKLDLKNLNVLEIGSGLSLPSFIATKRGANVLATDFHDDVETFLKINQNENNINFDYKKINWRLQNYDLGLFELVIGSDILYESAHPELVAKALIHYLAPNGKIILSDPGRAYIQKFVKAMNGMNFKEKMTVEVIRTKWLEKEVFIFEFEKTN